MEISDSSLYALYSKIIVSLTLLLVLMLKKFCEWAGSEAGDADISANIGNGCMFLWGNELRKASSGCCGKGIVCTQAQWPRSHWKCHSPLGFHYRAVHDLLFH